MESAFVMNECSLQQNVAIQTWVTPYHLQCLPLITFESRKWKYSMWMQDSGYLVIVKNKRTYSPIPQFPSSSPTALSTLYIKFLIHPSYNMAHWYWSLNTTSQWMFKHDITLMWWLHKSEYYLYTWTIVDQAITTIPHVSEFYVSWSGLKVTLSQNSVWI